MNCIKKISKERYSLFLGDEETPCPGLLDFKCTIHKKRNRPLACRQYPVFVDGKTVNLSHRCLAVKQNVFYPFIQQWEKLGYKVKETSACFDSEFYNLKV